MYHHRWAVCVGGQGCGNRAEESPPKPPESASSYEQQLSSYGDADEPRSGVANHGNVIHFAVATVALLQVAGVCHPAVGYAAGDVLVWARRDAMQVVAVWKEIGRCDGQGCVAPSSCARSPA